MFLPSDDPDPTKRAADVAAARSQYAWDHVFLAPLPMLSIPETGKHPGVIEFLEGTYEELPPAEVPRDGMIGERNRETLPGVLAISADELAVFLHRGFHSPEDYAQLYAATKTPENIVGNPSIEADWSDDGVFAWQRLAGPNPGAIVALDPKRFGEMLPSLRVDDSHLRTALGQPDATLAAAVAAGRLFAVDHTALLAGIPTGVQDGRKKFLPTAPLVLYFDAARGMLPVSVRLPGRTVAADASNPQWAVAKAHFAVADFNSHEMGTHLGLVHFLQEGIAVAAARTLPASHPVGAYARELFKYLLWNNFAGRELLVQPGGFVEKILAGELATGSMEIVRRVYNAFTWDDLDLPNHFASRGTLGGTLTLYPYRDDALLVWEAIGPWVREFVAAWYPSDEAVARDAELAAFAREMTSTEGAHLRGFPEEIDSREALATVLHRLTFLAGPQHAAVNYPQMRAMMFVPNMPGASWSDPALDAELMQVLPPVSAAHQQTLAIWTLTCYQYGRLGTYSSAFDDPRHREANARFRTALVQVEDRIAGRNRGERASRPYLYLLPSRIPNSTNI